MGEFRMPSLGADMERGTVVEWRVRPGDAVRRGDIVAVVDTEKATIEVEVFESGVVERLLVGVGEEVPVGTPLAVITGTAVAPLPSPPAPLLPSPAPAPTPLLPSPAPAPTPIAAPIPLTHPHRVTSPLVRRLAAERGVDIDRVPATGRGGVVTRTDIEGLGRGRVRSSPLARRRAGELGIDLTGLTGTGPRGAVRAADIAQLPSPAPPTAPPSAPAPAGRQERLRRAVGALMARSAREVPHYYLSTTIDLGAAVAWVRSANEKLAVAERLVPAALLLKATALAARRTPRFNGHWRDGDFVPAAAVDLGVAINLRGGGLIAPAIAGADELALPELMARLRDLTTRARAGTMRSSEMADPTITVTSLGDRGVDAVFGVIYAPQVALVGFGRIAERPWAVDGLLGVRPVVVASLAADHRVSEGHEGAAFLTTIESLLQEPEAL